MPIHEYSCEKGHKFERFFTTFRAADEEQTVTACDEDGCDAVAHRGIGLPFPAMFYGNPDGYHKPSPTKRHSTKLVSAKDGNKHSIG